MFFKFERHPHISKIIFMVEIHLQYFILILIVFWLMIFKFKASLHSHNVVVLSEILSQSGRSQMSIWTSLLLPKSYFLCMFVLPLYHFKVTYLCGHNILKSNLINILLVLSLFVILLLSYCVIVIISYQLVI